MEKVLLHKVTKEEESFAKLRVSNTELAMIVSSLKQKLTILCYQSTVNLAGNDLGNLIEH